jgi:hypothetical protein
MPEVVRGVIHGKTIELLADPGIADGRRVEITIRSIAQQDDRTDAIVRTAGSMANDPEFEAVMEEVRRYRNRETTVTPAVTKRHSRIA